MTNPIQPSETAEQSSCATGQPSARDPGLADALLNDWFLSLPKERQEVLLQDKWLLASAALEAGRRLERRERPYTRADMQDAFKSGYCSLGTYNDTEMSDIDEEWQKYEATLLTQPVTAAKVAVKNSLRAKKSQNEKELPEFAGWSVFNTAAEVASGLTLQEVMEYLTPERLARGWTAVCVFDKDNFPRSNSTASQDRAELMLLANIAMRAGWQQGDLAKFLMGRLFPADPATPQADYRQAALFAKGQFQKFFQAMNAKDYKMAGMHVMDAEMRLTSLLLPTKDSGTEPVEAQAIIAQGFKLLPPEPTADMKSALAEAKVRYRILKLKKGEKNFALPFEDQYKALYEAAPAAPATLAGTGPTHPDAEEVPPPPGWKKFLRSMEWYEVEHNDQSDTWESSCPSCHALQSAGHESDCELAALLKAAGDK